MFCVIPTYIRNLCTAVCSCHIYSYIEVVSTLLLRLSVLHMWVGSGSIYIILFSLYLEELLKKVTLPIYRLAQIVQATRTRTRQTQDYMQYIYVCISLYAQDVGTSTTAYIVYIYIHVTVSVVLHVELYLYLSVAYVLRYILQIIIFLVGPLPALK